MKPFKTHLETEEEEHSVVRRMGVDLRQVVAGILTVTMFVMLGQMLHRDYFDAVQVITSCLSLIDL